MDQQCDQHDHNNTDAGIDIAQMGLDPIPPADRQRLFNNVYLSDRSARFADVDRLKQAVFFIAVVSVFAVILSVVITAFAVIQRVVLSVCFIVFNVKVIFVIIIHAVILIICQLNPPLSAKQKFCRMQTNHTIPIIRYTGIISKYVFPCQ